MALPGVKGLNKQQGVFTYDVFQKAHVDFAWIFVCKNNFDSVSLSGKAINNIRTKDDRQAPSPNFNHLFRHFSI